ncbi:uncharacterized protein LOC108954398 [Eucalyptus grandis]|uniref:uncharacterized protein LOC108954398 n=1 Tax=Eucalyptus grandis TaxID=71139 RepID=UPI00192EBC83|nr:uncharacterized protein LOC108954398 [Eucalyptus grandis]
MAVERRARRPEDAGRRRSSGWTRGCMGLDATSELAALVGLRGFGRLLVALHWFLKLFPFLYHGESCCTGGFGEGEASLKQGAPKSSSSFNTCFKDEDIGFTSIDGSDNYCLIGCLLLLNADGADAVAFPSPTDRRSIGDSRTSEGHQPQASDGRASAATRSGKADGLHYTNKLHAFVQYESINVAEKTAKPSQARGRRDMMEKNPGKKKMLLYLSNDQSNNLRSLLSNLMLTSKGIWGRAERG